MADPIRLNRVPEPERIVRFVDMGQSHVTVMVQLGVQYCEGSTSPHPDGAEHDTTFVEGVFALTPPPDSRMIEHGNWPPSSGAQTDRLRLYITDEVVKAVERAMNLFPGASLVGWQPPEEEKAGS